MAKAKRNQNPAKPFSTMQTVDSYSLMAPVPMPSPEDAGVCVVCEDECTCGAARTPSSSSAAALAPASSSSSTSIPRRIILLPPRPAIEPGSFSVSGLDNEASSAIQSGPIHSVSHIVQRKVTAAKNSKKRGRPSKADLHARQQAARSAAVVPRRNTTGTNIVKKSAASISRQHTGAAAPTARFPTFVPASVFGSDSSLSSPSSSSASEDDSSSSSSDDSLDSDGDTDSEVEAEEEQLIVQETLAMQKLRARRELESALGGGGSANSNKNENTNENENGGRRRWDKMNWKNHKKDSHRRTEGGDDHHRHGAHSSSPPESDGDDDDSNDSDDSDDSGSGGDDEHEQEEDDPDGMDDDDDDDAFEKALNGGWSDGDEEERIDAELFFANLSDSSFDSSDDSDGEHAHPRVPPLSSSVFSTGTVDDDDLFGFGSSTATRPGAAQDTLPLVVTENWDGQLVFAPGLEEGNDLQMLDIILNAALAASVTSSSSGAAVPVTEGGVVEGPSTASDDADDYASLDGSMTEDALTSDEEEYQPLSEFDHHPDPLGAAGIALLGAAWGEDEDGMDLNMMSMGVYGDGETTDEDELHPELGSILFGIVGAGGNNPPAKAKVVKIPKHHRQGSNSNFVLPSSKAQPQALSNNTKAPKTEVKANTRLTPALSATSTSASSSAGSNKLIPVMGSFTISADLSALTTCTAVIDGSRDGTVLPSPYPRPLPPPPATPIARVKSRGRGRKRSGSGSGVKRRAVQQNPEAEADRSPKRVRQSSSQQPRTPSPFSRSRSNSTKTEPESYTYETTPPRPVPIDLDDVLYTDHLSDGDETATGGAGTGVGYSSDVTATPQQHHQRSRWDRIPINAFHRLRSAAQSHGGGVLGSPVSTTVTVSSGGTSGRARSHSHGHPPMSLGLGLMQSPRPADGFSYGATPSVVSPYASAATGYWDQQHPPNRPSHSRVNSRSSPHASPRPRHAGRARGNSLMSTSTMPHAQLRMAGTEKEKRAMLVPPVVVPGKEDDQTTPTKNKVKAAKVKMEKDGSSDMDCSDSS